MIEQLLVNLTPFQYKIGYYFLKYWNREGMKQSKSVGIAVTINKDGDKILHRIIRTNITEDSEKYAWLINEIKENGCSDTIYSGDYFPMVPIRIGAFLLRDGELYWSVYRPDEGMFDPPEGISFIEDDDV